MNFRRHSESLPISETSFIRLPQKIFRVRKSSASAVRNQLPENMKPKNNLSSSSIILGLLALTVVTNRVAADDLFNVPPPNSASASSSERQPAGELMERPSFQPLTVDAEVGTTGVGAGANWRLANHFGVGGAFDYLTYTYNGSIKDNSYNLHLHLMSEPLTLDLYPSKNSSFHVSAGLAFNQNRLNGSTTGNINLNGTVYPGTTANLEIKPQRVDPYLSLGGNVYFDSGHHVSLGGELGVMYTGDPRVTLTTTPAANPSDVQAEEAKIKSYAKDLQFWPVIKVKLNFSF